MTRDGRPDHPCEALSALVDGELNGGERAAIEAHLAECAPCRALKDDFEVLGGAVAAEAPPEVPADLAARIRGRLGERPAARHQAWVWWRLRWPAPMPAAAAAAVVVAALVWMAWPGGRPPGESVASREATTSDVPRKATGAPAAPPAKEAPAVPTAVAETAGAPAERASRGMSPVPPPMRVPAPAAATPSAGTARDIVEPKSRLSAASPDAEADRLRAARAALPGGPEPAWSRVDSVQGRAASDLGTLSAEDSAKDEVTGFARAPAQAARREGGAVAPPPAPAAAAPPSAARLLDASPYVVSLLPDGTMSVRAPGYQCIVPITPEDARLLAAFGDAAAAPVAVAGRAAENREDPASAMSAGPAAGGAPSAPSGAAESAPTSAAAVASAAEPAPAILPPAARQAVVRLVREHYRALIEERCGPLPR